MLQYRWSDGIKQAWEFAAPDNEFARLALDTLIDARLKCRRRIHDGRTRRYYWLYDQLQLHVRLNRTWQLVAAVPLLVVWDDTEPQYPPYDPAQWLDRIHVLAEYNRKLAMLFTAVSDEVTRHIEKGGSQGE